MPIVSETMAFNGDALRLLEIFQDEPGLFFLDGSMSEAPDGRYCYLGFSPFKQVSLKDMGQLRQAIKPYMTLPRKAGFPAGAVGTIGYDGQLHFGLYESVLCLDQHHKTLTFTSTGQPYQQRAAQAKAIQQKMEYLRVKLKSPAPTRPLRKAFGRRVTIKGDTSPQQYKSSVKKALMHIRQGDIYQINLAHRLYAPIRRWSQYVHPLDIYRQLRRLSPSPFSAYLQAGKEAILSSSPERFIQLREDVVQVRPMKGTRPRGRTERQDRCNQEDLLHSSKEKAELLMVTDLERNDLGRVCRYGSVQVKSLRTIEPYRTVFQATSTVEGRLDPRFDQFDLLEATFPSGSVTGTPKIEAMKIISQLERTNRGLYTGALGYISFTGDMDFSVLIRTIFLREQEISFFVGSGIVADSDPQKEYEETILKSKAMVQALNKAFRRGKT